MAARLVAIGASAGSLVPLQTLAAALPPDFPGVVVITLHVGALPSLLPELLNRAGPLRAVHPADGERILAGRIYVAPPDRHLVIEHGRLRLDRGPKEHHTRPAVDPMFRSAAAAYGNAVVGVLLSGRLDDGVLGLQRIREAGGVVVVQDPREAEEPSMPHSALRHVAVDHVSPAGELGGMLVGLVTDPLPARTALVNSTASERDIADGQQRDAHAHAGVQVPWVCPDCRGSLVRLDTSPPHFRCHVGHAFTLNTLHAAQAEWTEQALWSALSALQEKEMLLAEMASNARDLDDEALATEYEADALTLRAQAETLRHVIDGSRIPTDVPTTPAALQASDARSRVS